MDAQLSIRVEATDVEKAVRELEKLPGSGRAAEASVRSLENAAEDMGDAMKRGAAAVKAMEAAQNASAKATGFQSYQLKNLAFQLNDIGVSLASGMNPMMVLAQQGTQIAEIFATSGVGAGAALKQFGGLALSAAGSFGPLLAAAAAVGVTFGVATQQINKNVGEIGAGMGLTAEEIEKVRANGVTMGDTFKATFQVIGDAINQVFGPTLKAAKAAIADFYQKGVDGVVSYVKTMVGAYYGAFGAIKAVWGMLPAALGDAAISAANLVISGIEGMINKAVSGLNMVIGVANSLGANITLISPVQLARIENQYAGAMESVAKAGTEAFNSYAARGRAAVDGVFLAIAQQSIRNSLGRAEANDKATEAAQRGTRAIRDQTSALDDNNRAIRANVKAFDELIGPYERLERNAVPAVDNLITTQERLAEVTKTRLQIPLEDAALAMEQAFLGVRDAVDGVFSSIAGQNWGGALGGIASSLRAITQSASSVGMLGTLGNIAGAASPYVGGKFGKALNGISAFGQLGSLAGAGSLFGAGSAGLFGGTTIAPMVLQSATGATIAGTVGTAGGLGGTLAGLGGAIASNPIGWIVGAGILASTLLGGNAKRRRERRASENEAAAQAIEGIQSAARQQFGLEIQILELSGKTAQAVARQREDELSALDATSRALQEQIYALQDFKDELAKLDDKISGARSDLTSAYEREASALQSVIDSFASLADSLGAYAQTLRGNLAANDNQSLDYARGRFRMTAGSALTGDQAALAALQGIGEEYRSAALAAAPDRLTYARAMAEILGTVQAAQGQAVARIDTAREQLMSLQTAVGALITINQSTLSVKEAIDNLTRLEAARAAKEAEMQAAAAAATAGIGSGGAKIVTDFAAYVRKNPDLLALYSSNSGMARGRTIEEFGAYHYANWGAAEIAAGQRAFATGGSFTVGGSGGTDTTPVSFMATPGEIVNISRQDSMGALLKAVERQISVLREQNALLVRQNDILRSSADSSDKTAKILTRVTRDGESLLTEAA